MLVNTLRRQVLKIRKVHTYYFSKYYCNTLIHTYTSDIIACKATTEIYNKAVRISNLV